MRWPKKVVLYWDGLGTLRAARGAGYPMHDGERIYVLAPKRRARKAKR